VQKRKIQTQTNIFCFTTQVQLFSSSAQVLLLEYGRKPCFCMFCFTLGLTVQYTSIWIIYFVIVKWRIQRNYLANIEREILFIELTKCGKNKLTYEHLKAISAQRGSAKDLKVQKCLRVAESAPPLLKKKLRKKNKQDATIKFRIFRFGFQTIINKLRGAMFSITFTIK